MTLYFVDPENGCNKYDGLTAETAFASKHFAELVSVVRSGQCYCEKCTANDDIEILLEGCEEEGE